MAPLPDFPDDAHGLEHRRCSLIVDLDTEQNPASSVGVQAAPSIRAPHTAALVRSAKALLIFEISGIATGRVLNVTLPLLS